MTLTTPGAAYLQHRTNGREHERPVLAGWSGFDLRLHRGQAVASVADSDGLHLRPRGVAAGGNYGRRRMGTADMVGRLPGRGLEATMTVENIRSCANTARKFLECVDLVLINSVRPIKFVDADGEYLDYGKHSAKLRRASMDLTRALAEMRKP